jgi:hypothetical protein
VLANMMNGSQSVSIVNGFINDLSSAATEVQKETKVCSSYPYFVVFFYYVLFHCSSIFMYSHVRTPCFLFSFGHCNRALLFLWCSKNMHLCSQMLKQIRMFASIMVNGLDV